MRSTPKNRPNFEYIVNGKSSKYSLDSSIQNLADDKLYIGKKFTNQEFFNGEIAEILIYDRVLSDKDITLMSAYLDNKWQLGYGLTQLNTNNDETQRNLRTYTISYQSNIAETRVKYPLHQNYLLTMRFRSKVVGNSPNKKAAGNSIFKLTDASDIFKLNDHSCHINSNGHLEYNIMQRGNAILNQQLVNDGNWHSVTLLKAGSKLGYIIDGKRGEYLFKSMSPAKNAIFRLGNFPHSGPFKGEIKYFAYWMEKAKDINRARDALFHPKRLDHIYTEDELKSFNPSLLKVSQ